MTVPVDPLAKEVTYNPMYEQLFAPEVGPAHPFKTPQQLMKKNALAGNVEEGEFNQFQFETQRRTFQSYGKLSTVSVIHYSPL